MATIQKITPNLWFDRQAEEAAKFYVSIFKNSKIGAITRFGQEGFEYHKIPEGTVMTVSFWIEGVEFIALNGGLKDKFGLSWQVVPVILNEMMVDFGAQKVKRAYEGIG